VERALEERIVGATVAGKYRIRRVVGAGSMGVVCEAEHLEIGKRLAIKLIDASLAGMSDVAMRFRQEARAASLVESHHIVQVFDVGADDKLGLYLVMEFLHGEDLSRVLARERRLDTETAVRIAVQAARGLAKAHEAGVVHRDLKPANLFLCDREDDDPLVKILDFGISKVIDASRADSKLKLTRAGTVVGTPQYMSPEQARGYSVDMRTDVWALGLVLYEMLAGRPAYPELPTYEQFIIHLVSHPPDPITRVAPWVPEPLARVVHQSVEHDVDRRVPTCAELVKRLLEAHPLTNVRSSIVAAAEIANTWSDVDPRSKPPTDPSGDSYEETDPRGRTAIMSELPGDDSITVDIDLGFDPPPPPSTRRPSSGSLAASGVRGASADEGDGDDEDDAPQFFDRSAIEKLASQGRIPVAGPSSPTLQRAAPAARPSAPMVAARMRSDLSTAPPVARATSGGDPAAAAQGDAVAGVLRAAAAADIVRAAVARVRRVPLALAVGAVLAVALAVVAAIAFR
jgi:serine/threonine protein kinase